MALQAGLSPEGPVIRWYSISGATYEVHRATNLLGGTPFSSIAGDVPATHPLNCYTDRTASGRVIFYTVRQR